MKRFTTEFTRATTRGFTLVESLVAITVLLAAVTGPLTIAAQGISLANFARQQITAIFLAQEAIEYIRSVRDGNILDPDSAGWLDGLTACIDIAPCMIDVTLPSVQACSGGTCPAMRFHEESGHYGYSGSSGWEDTPFTRSITITEIDEDTEVQVEVEVSWETGVLTKDFTLNENLLNWQL